jgi:8-oxo-dGTP diphosphatase
VLELETDGTRHHVFEVSVLNLEQLRPLNEITDCIWHPLDALHNLNISDAMRSIVSAFVRRL